MANGLANDATQLTTRVDVLREFLRRPSPRVMLSGFVVVLFARLLVGGVVPIDFGLLLLTAVLVGPVEWFLHRVLLHATEQSFQMRRLGTGIAHREHHRNPGDLEFVLLGGFDAALFIVLLAGWTALWVSPLIFVTGSAWLGPYLTATAAALLALVHYEWVHLLVHTRVRLSSRIYRRLSTNHRLHHFRNEHYWLGVTNNVGDRIMKTYPAAKGDVPMSDTARELSG